MRCDQTASSFTDLLLAFEEIYKLPHKAARLFFSIFLSVYMILIRFDIQIFNTLLLIRNLIFRNGFPDAMHFFHDSDF